MTSRHWITSNLRWYFNVKMYNVIQREINVVYFNFHINSVREGQNNIVIFNVKSHNVGQRRNNIVNMTICKKLMRAEKYF